MMSVSGPSSVGRRKGAVAIGYDDAQTDVRERSDGSWTGVRWQFACIYHQNSQAGQVKHHFQAGVRAGALEKKRRRGEGGRGGEGK